MRSWGLGKRRKREGWITLWKICVGQVGRFCVFDVHQCQLPREKGRTKRQSPGRRCPRQGLRAPALASALHTLNHSVNVNCNYRS